MTLLFLPPGSPATVPPRYATCPRTAWEGLPFGVMLALANPTALVYPRLSRSRWLHLPGK